MSADPRQAKLITAPMIVTVLLLASTPLWLKQAGLYQYLALEIMIWMLFALGHNLLLGYAGLPSFGHGAYFGIGAYALGLLQLRGGAGLLLALLGATLAAAAFGALVAAFISHRRGIYYALLTIAFGQLFWFVAGKWHSLTGGEDGLLNIKRSVLSLPGVDIDLRSNEALFFSRCSCSRWCWSACGGWCIHRSVGCCAPSSKTRCARLSSATTSGSTSGWPS